MQQPISRRDLVSSLAVCAAGAAIALRTAGAAETPKLDVRDTAATALGYVEDAGQVDAKKYPAFVQGSVCENCAQLTGKAGEAYRPCTLFPGKLVSIKGWCSGWAAEM